MEEQIEAICFRESKLESTNGTEPLTNLRRGATVHDIPYELFVDIFSRALPHPSATLHTQYAGDIGYYYRPLHAFRSVCTTWASVIDTTPAFWTLTSASCRPETTEQHIRKAQKVDTLHVRVYTRPGIRTFLHQYGDLVVPLVHKWESLFLHVCQNVFGDTDRFLTEPAPRLQSLFLTIDNTRTETVQPFRGEAPRVSRLEISLSLRPIYTFIFPGLVSLAFTGLTDAPSMKDLLYLLKRSPLLEVLDFSTSKIRYSTIPYRAKTLWASLIPVHLPHLRSVALHRTPKAVEQFLEAIPIPLTANLSIHETGGYKNLRRIVRPLGDRLATICDDDTESIPAHLSLSVDTWSLDFDYGSGFCRGVFSAGKGIDLNQSTDLGPLTATRVARITNSILEALSNSPSLTRCFLPTTITLKCPQMHNVEYVLAVFDHWLPNVMSLSLNCGDTSLDKLVARKIGPDEGARWIFPELSTLEIPFPSGRDGQRWLDTVVWALQRRRSGPSPASSSRGVPLKKLVIKGASNGVISEGRYQMLCGLAEEVVLAKQDIVTDVPEDDVWKTNGV